jgi:PAS domain S-box-containing protein
VLDGDGVLLEWSAGAERLLGYSSSEAVGRSATDLILGPLSDQVRQAVATRSPWSGAIELRHRNGEGVTVELVAVATAEDDGAPRWSLMVVAAPGVERYPREEEVLTEWAFKQRGSPPRSSTRTAGC